MVLWSLLIVSIVLGMSCPIFLLLISLIHDGWLCTTYGSACADGHANGDGITISDNVVPHMDK